MIDGFVNIASDIPYIAIGAWITLTLTVVAMSVGVVMGLFLVFARLSGLPVLSQLAIGWIDFFLLTPPLVHIIWAYYVLPIVTGWRLDGITVCAIALSASVGAHMAEVFRGGLQAIAKTQHRAADVLGLSTFDKYRFVILPQTLRVILAPSTNVLVSLLKDTSLAAVIGLGEILHRAEVTASSNFLFLEILTFVAILYASLNYPLILLARRLEVRSRAGFASV